MVEFKHFFIQLKWARAVDDGSMFWLIHIGLIKRKYHRMNMITLCDSGSSRTTIIIIIIIFEFYAPYFIYSSHEWVIARLVMKRIVKKQQ